MNKISDKELIAFLKDPIRLHRKKDHDESEIMFTVGMARELLTLRQQNAELERQLKISAYLSDKTREGFDWKVLDKILELELQNEDLHQELLTLRQQNAELIENSERLADDVVWCGGSDDFAPDGKAHAGYKKVMEDVKQHADLMSRIKGE